MTVKARVCFVCLGNICRSPTAEGIFIRLVGKEGYAEEILIESAGTGSWHVGELPDLRSRKVAKEYGIELTSRAQQFTPMDFDRFDLIVVMDESNRTNVLAMARNEKDRAKVKKMRSYQASVKGEPDVPDPYFGSGDSGFHCVFEMCEEACEGLLAEVKKNFLGK